MKLEYFITLLVNTATLCCCSPNSTAAERFLKLGINESANPCDDFYEYSCSNFASQVDIPKVWRDKGKYPMPDYLTERLDNILLARLQNNSQPLDGSLKSLKNAMDNCVEQETNPKAQLEWLKRDLLVYMRSLGGFPLLKEWIRPAKVDQLETTRTLLQDYGDTAFLSLTYSLMGQVSDANALQLHINHGYYEFSNMKRSAMWLSNELDMELISESQLEKRFAKLELLYKSFPKCGSTDNLIPIESLSPFVPQLAGMLRSISERPEPPLLLDPSTLIMSKCSKDDFIAINNFLTSHHLSEGVQSLLLMYLVTTVHEEYLLTNARLPPNIETTENLLPRSPLSALPKYHDPQKICLQTLSESKPFYKYLLIRLLVTSSGSRFNLTSRVAIRQMVEGIKWQFREEIFEQKWLDDDSRLRLLASLQELPWYVGFPRWLDDEDDFEAYFRGFDVFPNTSFLFNNQLVAGRHKVRDRLERSQEPRPHKVYPFVVSMVNAFYWPYGGYRYYNLFTGIIEKLFFDPTYPISMQYGALGYVIGHELIHAYGPEGIGHKLTPSAHESFNKSIECLVNQYSNCCRQIFNETHCVDGLNTQEENTADNVGMRLSYQAFKSAEKTEEKVAGFTSSQAFFVAASKFHCGWYSENATLIYYKGSHSPPRVRVNELMKNSAEFAAAFECPQGSPMNPQKKCRVW